MSENHQSTPTNNNLPQPDSQNQEQELDDASLNEVSGGTNKGAATVGSSIINKMHELKKAIIGNLPR